MLTLWITWRGEGGVGGREGDDDSATAAAAAAAAAAASATTAAATATAAANLDFNPPLSRPDVEISVCRGAKSIPHHEKGGIAWET